MEEAVLCGEIVDGVVDGVAASVTEARHAAIIRPCLMSEEVSARRASVSSHLQTVLICVRQKSLIIYDEPYC